MGFPPEDADTGADLLVWANLRGVDSHGVLRLPRLVRMVDAGHLNPKPDIRILKETPAVLSIDADGGLSAVTAPLAMKWAIEKAKVVGIGWALIANTTSPLAIGYYTQMAAKVDMVGIAITHGQPNMAPYGARAPGLHNGPISIAVPAKGHRPVVLDMATSVFGLSPSNPWISGQTNLINRPAGATTRALCCERTRPAADRADGRGQQRPPALASAGSPPG